jgi:hypothetical protein
MHEENPTDSREVHELSPLEKLINQEMPTIRNPKTMNPMSGQAPWMMCGTSMIAFVNDARQYLKCPSISIISQSEDHFGIGSTKLHYVMR